MGTGGLIGDFFQFWWRRKVLVSYKIRNYRFQLSLLSAFVKDCVVTASIQERKKLQKCTKAFVL